MRRLALGASRGVVRAARTARRPPVAPQRGTSILGATVGVTVGSITGTLVTWPIADILLGPYFIKQGLLASVPANTNASTPPDLDAASLRNLVGSTEISDARLSVLTGGTREQRLALAHEASRGRPTLRLNMRQATAPHSMFMAVIDSLYKPLAFSPLYSCLATVWLTLFDMLIPDHDHTRQRDLCVVLSQTSRALDMVGDQAPRRPLIIVEHLFVPMDAEGDPGGEGLSPMLRSLRQWLCAVSIDSHRADVLVLTPTGSAAGDSALSAWRGEARRSCAKRIRLEGGIVAIALSQSEAVDRWLGGCRLRRQDSV